MKFSNRKHQLLAGITALAATFAGDAYATLSLTGQTYVTYGGANSYALQVDSTISGCTGPGCPLYVKSTPGAIQDLIVIATGASGVPVNTNVAGMDNAMPTPNGTGAPNFFSGIWNSTLAAFTGALNGLNPIFFFNNNQVNSGASTNQNLATWAQVSLTGAGMNTLFLTFTNTAHPYALFTEGGGGVFMGTAADFTTAGLNVAPSALPGPLAGTNLRTDYVLSGGAICLNAANNPVSCSDPSAVSGPINNNLGANQAAYAIDAPALDTFLTGWENGLFQGYTDIHVNLRFGCDPATIGTNGGTAGVGDCVGRDANNGFEQLFVGTAATVTNVPEPESLWLISLGLLGLVVARRRNA
jgi:hypothetical protein